MKKFLSYLIGTILIVSVFVQSISINSYFVTADESKKETWPSAPEIVGETAILIEPETGTILYDKNSHKKMYPASITKIMTALLTLEHCDLNDTVVYSENAIKSITAEDSNIQCKIGEQMSVRECLYALMLSSANETATALAEHICGSVDKFSELMNQRAKELGAKDLHFANPNGLHDANHYVTAYDMALIMKQAISYPAFLDIIHSTVYTIGKNNKRKQDFPSYNRHRMIFSTSEYYYDSVIGGKTGYTDQAGKTLVTCAKKGGMTLICVVLKSDGDVVFKDTAKLFDYGFNNFSYENISTKDNRFTNNRRRSLVSPFSQDNRHIYLEDNCYVVVPKNTDISKLHTHVDFKVSGDSFATITYQYAGRDLGSAKIKYASSEQKEKATTESVKNEKTTTASKTDHVIQNKNSTSPKKTIKVSPLFIVAIIVLLFVLILIVIIFIQKRKINNIRAMKRNRKR